MKNHRELYQALLDGETITVIKEKAIYFQVNPEWVLIDNTIIESKKTGHVLVNFNLEDLTSKPRTININGFEVPEPCRKPLEVRTTYYYFDVFISARCCVNDCQWEGDEIDNKLLDMGIIHLTEEAAIQHAKALLSFTEVK
jgi:hypothetical protein